jgi:hypothetical protein
VLVLKPVPRKAALILVEPAGRDDNVMEAVPAVTGISPTITFPVLNRTVPTGAAPVAVTVAVKVTDSPAADGFWEEVSTVDVGSFAPR